MSEGKFSSVNLCPVLKSNEKIIILYSIQTVIIMLIFICKLFLKIFETEL